MNLRHQMRRAAERAPGRLPDSGESVVSFLRSTMNLDGGFKDRSGKSDLYYTVFGVEALAALKADPPADALRAYVRSFGDGESLDFVHLACLARCAANLPQDAVSPETRAAMLRRLEANRTADGGYSPRPAASHGTAYACFLALGAHQDLGSPGPESERLMQCLRSLRTKDGAYANEPGGASGSTPATAAVVMLLGHLGEPVEPQVGDWLLARACPAGGFLAMPAAPIPDLLSTATALHALASMGVSYDAIKEAGLDFTLSLGSSQGGFRGHRIDDTPDCEYTFYALLALGHLSPY